MSQSIQSLIRSGTRLWLDSVDPDLVRENFAMGATGATSNPIIIADLIKTGRFDDQIRKALTGAKDPEEVAWQVTDYLVSSAESVFKPVYDRAKGDDGYVSFELDPLLEDASCALSLRDRAARYIELGKAWSRNHPNRMIKIPATPAGLMSLEELAAAGVPLNVTLIFSKRQYEAAREAVWRGAKTLKSLDRFKSVYSIFVSRIDVYTQAQYPQLSAEAQGLAGILNAKLLWLENLKFWAAHRTPLRQEIIFASTGTKNPADKPWKYVEALAGSDIQTNPPATNAAVASSNQNFSAKISALPPESVVSELLAKVDWHKLEEDLMRDGLAKFADPHKALLQLVRSKISGMS
jgi:transaldolase